MLITSKYKSPMLTPRRMEWGRTGKRQRPWQPPQDKMSGGRLASPSSVQANYQHTHLRGAHWHHFWSRADSSCSLPAAAAVGEEQGRPPACGASWIWNLGHREESGNWVGASGGIDSVRKREAIVHWFHREWGFRTGPQRPDRFLRFYWDASITQRCAETRPLRTPESSSEVKGG